MHKILTFTGSIAVPLYRSFEGWNEICSNVDGFPLSNVSKLMGQIEQDGGAPNRILN